LKDQKRKTVVTTKIISGTKLVKKNGEARQGVRCPILTNWSTRKDGVCNRWYMCRYREDQRCPAKDKI